MLLREPAPGEPLDDALGQAEPERPAEPEPASVRDEDELDVRVDGQAPLNWPLPTSKPAQDGRPLTVKLNGSPSGSTAAGVKS